MGKHKSLEEKKEKSTLHRNIKILILAQKTLGISLDSFYTGNFKVSIHDFLSGM